MTFGDLVLPDGFWRRVTPEPISGCWLWNGCLDDEGYGLVYTGGRQRLSHRVMFHAVNGRLPARPMVIDHLCRVRCCVNPWHLEEVTHRVNVLRGVGPSAVAAARAACAKGHPWDACNTRTSVGRWGTPQRACRICDAARQRLRTKRRNASKGGRP